jgi:23S rRNA (guanosine2251-2'-O)-methyltransferase
MKLVRSLLLGGFFFVDHSCYFCKVKTFRQSPARPKKSLLLAGLPSVAQALAAGKQLERIYVQQTMPGAIMQQIQQLSIQYQVPVNKVPPAKLQSFHIEGHEGVIGLISKIHYVPLQDMISFVVEKGDVPLFLILDGITDVRNIGAIARTAYCCGVQAIIIPDKGVGALNEDAIFTSAGALEKITVCRVNSLMKAVDDLHLNGIAVYASEMKATEMVQQLRLTEPTAIVMGGEEKGVLPALMKICDGNFRIPMTGDFESLNVSVATGMILYEAMQQRLRIQSK